MQHMLQMNKRIEYIDAIRGVTMILVVFSHIVVLCYNTKDLGTFNSVFINFRMPLFYFISGWVMYKSNWVWNLHTILTFFKKKFKVLLVATTIFWAIYNIYSYGTIHDEAFNSFKSGYWFTFTLFEFFCIYVITICICKGLHLKSKIEDFIIVIAGIFIYLVSSYYMHTYMWNKKPIDNTIMILMDYAGVFHWRYFLFFCIGSLIKKHLEVFHSLTDKNGVIALIVISFFIFVLFSNKIVILPHFYVPVTLSYSLLGILVIYTFFRKNAKQISKEKKIGRVLQFIGTRTIDIYFIHYFFLPKNLQVLGEVFIDNHNPSIEFFVTLAISMMVIAISLTIGSVIRLSPFLAQNLFGAKPIEQVTSK